MTEKGPDNKDNKGSKFNLSRRSFLSGLASITSPLGKEKIGLGTNTSRVVESFFKARDEKITLFI